jgi:hypothetical protein
MSILKYKVEVVRTDEYEIEIDDAIYTNDTIEEWSQHFLATDDESRQEDFVKHLAVAISMSGTAQGLEGFGYVKQKHCSMIQSDYYTQTAVGRRKVTEEEYNPGLIVTINSYEDQIETEIFKQ